MQPILLFLRRPVVRDGGLALLLVTLTALLGAGMLIPRSSDLKLIRDVGSEAAWRQHLLWWWVAAIPAVAALPLRRRWPVQAFLLAGLSAATHLLDPYVRQLPLDVAAVIALYTVATVTRSRRAGVALLSGALLCLYVVCLITQLRVGSPDLPDGSLKFAPSYRQPSVALVALGAAAVPGLLLGIAWAIGDSARTRRLHLVTLEQRAADLQREQDQQARLAVAAERARITRELHDVVAHGISVMVVQAQGGAAALRRHPDRTAAALTNVIDTGRASLTEMRRLLGLARRDLGGDQELAPQPGVGALAALIDQVRAAGTPVALEIEGDPPPLPPGVDLSVYRIVQEALTNTRKHAGAGASATVRLAFHETKLEIEVTDDGRGAATGPPAEDGNGLRGIAERVGALGGSVDAGPRAGGGFGVHALLPVTGDA